MLADRYPFISTAAPARHLGSHLLLAAVCYPIFYDAVHLLADDPSGAEIAHQLAVMRSEQADADTNWYLSSNRYFLI